MQKCCGTPGHRTPSRPHPTEMLRIWDMWGPRGGLPVGAQCPEGETPALASAPPPPREASALHQGPSQPLSGGPSPRCRLPAAGRAQRPPCLQKWLLWVQAESCRGLTVAPRDTAFPVLERGLQGHAASSPVILRPVSPGCLSSELSHVLLRPCTPDRGPRGPWMVRTGAGGQRMSSPGSASSTAPSRPPACSGTGAVPASLVRWAPGPPDAEVPLDLCPPVPVPRGPNSIHCCHGNRDLFTQVSASEQSQAAGAGLGPEWLLRAQPWLARPRPLWAEKRPSGEKQPEPEKSRFLPPAVDRPRPSRGAALSPTTAAWRRCQPPHCPLCQGQAPQPRTLRSGEQGQHGGRAQP